MVTYIVSLTVSPVPIPFVHLFSCDAQLVCQIFDMIGWPIGVVFILDQHYSRLYMRHPSIWSLLGGKRIADWNRALRRLKPDSATACVIITDSDRLVWGWNHAFRLIGWNNLWFILPLWLLNRITQIGSFDHNFIMLSLEIHLLDHIWRVMLWLDIYRLDHIRQGKVAALNSLATDLGIDLGSHLRNRWKLGWIH